VDFGPVEKRIGKRRQIRSVPMAWVRDPNHPDPWAAENKPDGRITELSISGLGMVAISHPYLEVGSLVLITAAGEVGKIIIRRIDPEMYPNQSYYGAEFAENESTFAKVLQKGFLNQDRNVPTAYIPRG
jgi:hypothetical protein